MIGVLSRALSLQEFVVFVNFITLLNESDSQSVDLCQNLVTAAYFQMGWLSFINDHRIYSGFTHTFNCYFNLEVVLRLLREHFLNFTNAERIYDWLTS